MDNKIKKKAVPLPGSRKKPNYLNQTLNCPTSREFKLCHIKNIARLNHRLTKRRNHITKYGNTRIFYGGLAVGKSHLSYSQPEDFIDHDELWMAAREKNNDKYSIKRFNQLHKIGIQSNDWTELNKLHQSVLIDTYPLWRNKTLLTWNPACVPSEFRWNEGSFIVTSFKGRKMNATQSKLFFSSNRELENQSKQMGIPITRGRYMPSNIKTTNPSSTRNLLCEIFDDPEKTRELIPGIKTFMTVHRNKIVVRDNQNSLVHGQILCPLTKGFDSASIAGDQGCGATVFKLSASLDEVKTRCGNIPTGTRTWNQIDPSIIKEYKNLLIPREIEKEFKKKTGVPLISKLGSLGGGNHFIHMVKNKDENALVIHTGSRGAYLNIKEIVSSLLKTNSSKGYELIQACERIGEFNRKVIYNYIENGTNDLKINSINNKIIVNSTHTKLHMDFSQPIVTKNLSRNNRKKPYFNLILGSPQSGVALIPSPDDEFYIHGTGPDIENPGCFKNLLSMEGHHLQSIYSFDRHHSGGGQN